MLKPIKKESGVNESERILVNQSIRTFFSLWCYPNLYRGEGKGKEMTDMLVYFDNQVILFSDKGEVLFQKDKELHLAWSRWYRACVKESAKQLYGAEAFLRRSKNNLFLDRKCENLFPFDLSSPDIKVHLVSIVRGASAHAKSHFDSLSVGSSGSLMHWYTFPEEELLKFPFTVGDTNKNKTFIHIIDDVSINLLFRELDSPSDFFHYLNSKEKAIRNGKLIGAAGEEEILAFYLQEMGNDGFGRLSPEVEEGQDWFIPEGEWLYYIQSEEYEQRAELKKQGKRWINIIENFSNSIMNATVGEFSEQPLLTHASALECLASENLISRAVLTEQLFDKYDSVPIKARSARAIGSICNPDKIFIFLFFPWVDHIHNSETYRQERFACMQLYAWVSRLKFSNMKEIIIMGSATQGMRAQSETILAIDATEKLTSAERQNVKKIMKEYNIFTNLKPLKKNTKKANVSPVKRFLKPGRNDLCPCQSGRKFKRCCIDRLDSSTFD